MKRYFIKLTYNGSNYQGWQSQPEKKSIQAEVRNALHLILKEEIVLTGAGRTDSGVHAQNYIAHFDSGSPGKKNTGDLVHKLNRFLPKDILVHDVFEVPAECHARFDAVSRTYHYLISRTKNPFLEDFALYVPQELDVEAMNKACSILMHHNDFASFSKLHGNNKTTICDLREAEWRWVNSDLLVFRITADRFLRNMVRAITGTMLRIGTHKIPVSELESIIIRRDRSAAGTSVAAKGLFLSEIRYKNIPLPENSYHLLNESVFF